MSGWRPALRIARRSMRRHLGRSILIASLIAVPIAGATVMDGLARTMSGPEADAYQHMGVADGMATITDQKSLPDWQPGSQECCGEPQRDPASVDLAELLPAGSRFVANVGYETLRLTEGDRIVRTQLEMVEIGDPLTDHTARLIAGREPAGPGEALVTEPLAERLGLLDDGELRPDATITADRGATVDVTGLAIQPTGLGRETVIAPPGSDLAPERPPAEANPIRLFLVDLPDGANPDAVWPALAERGVEFIPRAAFTEPGRYPAMFTVGGDFVETAGPVALVVGFGVLEVMLLAGAAFAVGARRQVRELGLVGANGGTARHVRRMVLAQGLFLGTLGALAGIAFGGLLLVAGESFWEMITGRLIEGWRFGWIELTLAGVVGLLSGLAAALLPAIGVARMTAADALAQRFRSTTLGARLPILGVVLTVVGIAGVVGAGLLGRRLLAEHLARIDESTQYYIEPNLVVPTIGLVLGGLCALVGILLTTSGLLATLARISGRLPLSGRLALRDAGRHRHRTVPAIAAIMIVVAGSVTLAFVFAASAVENLQTHPDNTIFVQPDPGSTVTAGDEEADTEAREQLDKGTRDVVAELPGSRTLDVTELDDRSGELPAMVALAAVNGQENICGGGVVHIGIGTPASLELAAGRAPDAAALAALDQGKVVALDECVVGAGGTARTEVFEDGPAPVELDAVHLEREPGTYFFALPAAFVSERTATELGWTARPAGVAVTYPAETSRDDIDTAFAAAEDAGLFLSAPSDLEGQIDLVNLALAGGAGLVTLLGVGITVALSGAESRADLATLAAIGAQPRRRRTLAGAQALVLSGLGTVLGVVVGGVLGYAMTPLAGETTFAWPWQSLLVTVLVVPLLAVGVAMVGTRARLPMSRRVD
ncbi:MAG TPA: FtsX-like permease family protein [Pseudonocardia sp.]|nr:FtsX-like permease family protein [Pseudonocardia sp.]